MPKYFTTTDRIADNIILLDEDTSAHIAKVLRGKVGDLLLIGDGNGTDYDCVIKEITKKQVTAEILSSHQNLNEPQVEITLYQSLPKGDKMELVIQKCVEIGIHRIVPIKTEHSVVNWDKKADKKTERWNKISLAAAKQCGRGIIPQVADIITFEQAIEDSKKYDGRIIPYEKEEDYSLKRFTKCFSAQENKKSIAVFIGPEGGFSDREIQLAKESGITSVTLGKRILRTETAGLVSTVILLHELED